MNAREAFEAIREANTRAGRYERERRGSNPRTRSGSLDRWCVIRDDNGQPVAEFSEFTAYGGPFARKRVTIMGVELLLTDDCPAELLQQALRALGLKVEG